MKRSINKSISKAVYIFGFLSLIFIVIQFYLYFSIRQTITVNQRLLKLEHESYQIINNSMEIESNFLNYILGYYPSSQKIILLLNKNSKLIDKFILTYPPEIRGKDIVALKEKHLTLERDISSFLSMNNNELQKEIILKEINETFFIIRLLFFNQENSFDKTSIISINNIQNELSVKLIFTILLSFSVFLIIAYSFHLKKILTNKISFLQKNIFDYSQNNLNKISSEPIEYKGEDEFSDVFNAFNEMMKTIFLQNQELKEREKKYRYLFENSTDALIISSLEGKFIDCNSATYKLFGIKEDKKELILSEAHNFSPKYQHDGTLSSIKAAQMIKLAIEKGRNFFNWTHQKLDGKTFEATVLLSTIEMGENSIILSTIRDVSEELLAKERKAQSQKMDAIGQLAGGVAHDFNNMLAGIMGAAQLLQYSQRNIDKKGLEFVDMIIKSSQRAADLTAKLLAFGRKGKVTSTIIDLHKIIDDTVTLFERTIDKKITILSSKEAKICTVVGDNSALQNALLNLGINASHAMLNGGELLIKTRNILLNENYCENSPFKIEPGEFVEIEVRDTGTGMSPSTLSKIFEPFFTTKKSGKGTGLGLASVYGTIQDHHGVITVYSELNKGTSFHILLPCSQNEIIAEVDNKVVLSGSGQILMVDDEELIRATGKYTLEEMGYKVLLAKDGFEAVKIFREKYSEIDLVIMDMIMPEMNGSEAFYKMKEIDENCKVIISSGFTKDENLNELKKAGLLGFIQKPFRDFELSKLISKILVKKQI